MYTCNVPGRTSHVLGHVHSASFESTDLGPRRDAMEFGSLYANDILSSQVYYPQDGRKAWGLRSEECSICDGKIQ